MWFRKPRVVHFYALGGTLGNIEDNGQGLFIIGQDRTGQDRTEQDRIGQDRTGQDRTG